MIDFFFQNRLSSWVDGHLTPSEQREFDEFLKKPEYEEEARSFSSAVQHIRGLKTQAPPNVLKIALTARKPAIPWLPWIMIPLVSFGIGALIAVVFPILSPSSSESPPP